MNLDLSNVLDFVKNAGLTTKGTQGKTKLEDMALQFSNEGLKPNETENITAKELFDSLNTEEQNGKKDDILSVDEFASNFNIEKNNDTQAEAVKNLYNMISSLDGADGISKGDLQQVMDLVSEDGFSLNDIGSFVDKIKEELDSTTTIVAGQSPTSLMKMIEGSDGKFNSEDYAALIKMNIQAGNIKEDDVKMTDSQKQKYGVDYMLHPGMNLKLYSQEEINKYKEDSFLDQIINDNKEKYGKDPIVETDVDGNVSTVAVGEKGTGNYHVFDIKNKSVTYYGTNNKPTVTYSNINSEGKVTDKSIVTSYTYNDDGATVQTNKDLNGNLISSEKYDKNGDLLNSVTWSDDGVLIKSETIRESAINGSVDSYKFKSDTDAYEAMKQNGNNPIAIVKKSDKEVYFAIGDKLFDLSGSLVE